MNLVSYNNGSYIPFNEAVIPIHEDILGTIRGLRIFTTAMCHGNKVFHLEDHVDRLLESAKILKFQIKETKESLSQLILNTLRKNREKGIETDLIMRTVISGGKKVASGLPEHPLIYITFEPMSEADKTKVDGVRLGTYPFQRAYPEIKFTNYVGGYMAELSLEGRADQALFITPEKPHKVLEGTTYSVFFVKENKVYTTPLNGCILDGITRRIICKLIKKDPTLTLVEEDSLTSELSQYEEVFITSSLCQIASVQSIDEKVYPLNGTVTKRVKDQFNTYIEHYFV